MGDSKFVAADEAVAMMREAGLEPLEPYPGMGVSWRCRCITCGKEVTPRPHAVKSGQGGCIECGHRKISASKFRDADEAESRMREAGMEPIEPYPGTQEPWRCRCSTCGAEGTPRLSNIQRGQGGCRHCASYGIDLGAPAILYVIEHRSLGAIKVGIANLDGLRLTKHRARGWEVFRVEHFRSGAQAHTVEQAVLAPYRETRLSPYLTASEMPQGGWTETIDAEATSLPALWAQVLAAAQKHGLDGPGA